MGTFLLYSTDNKAVAPEPMRLPKQKLMRDFLESLFFPPKHTALHSARICALYVDIIFLKLLGNIISPIFATKINIHGYSFRGLLAFLIKQE